MSIQQVWDLAQARCRFGKYLKLTVNGSSPDVAGLIKEFPPKKEQNEHGEFVKGLGVRMHLLRGDIQAEIELGHSARFYPSDAAIASWTHQAYMGQAKVVYE